MTRVLVAYGSKHNATAEIAERIGEVLRESGHQVDVTAAGAVRGTEDFDAVIVGSAVYMGRWRRDARALLRRLRKELRDRPLWLFSSGPFGEMEPDPDDRWQLPPRIRKLGIDLDARDHPVFAGRVPPEPGNVMERSMLKKTPEPDRDSRDFASISAWAKGIAADLPR